MFYDNTKPMYKLKIRKYLNNSTWFIHWQKLQRVQNHDKANK
jgi:hypothetical protein